ncbi:MAG: hypothetical protein R3F59_17245 [Myxococcota bacterium]
MLSMLKTNSMRNEPAMTKLIVRPRPVQMGMSELRWRGRPPPAA